MDPRPLQFFAQAAGGKILLGDPDAPVLRVCSDSRQVRAGDLFVALSGERFDGHDFLGDVAARGAVAVLVETAKLPSGFDACAVIGVDHPRIALARLAAGYRRQFDLPVIAVAGSNGKTTTKEMLGRLLAARGPALWSEASFNNDIGVPLTLLRLEQAHTAAVIEVGTNHPGEIAPLLRLVQPTHGVLTSIGREHLEFFGDVAGVAQEEGWLAELLPADGTLFVNGDGPEMEGITRRTRATVVRVGFAEGHDWVAGGVSVDEMGTTFQVRGPVARMNGEYRMRLLGRHQVVNALLAVAVGTELGLTREQAMRSLAGCTPPKMRLQLWEAEGVRVLDDSYNANADSMRAALRTLRDLPCGGRRVAVLGDMAELGTHSVAAHVEVGRYAAELGVNRLLAVGRMAGHLAGAARAAGLREASEFPEVGAAGAALRQELQRGDLVLLKASRAARLERVADWIRGDGTPAPA